MDLISNWLYLIVKRVTMLLLYRAVVFETLSAHFNDLLTFGFVTDIAQLQGSNEGNQHSIIETLPSASLLQTPGARADAVTWCDEAGHVWLFGGEGYDDDTSSTQSKLLNDLWLLNSSRLEWNLMHNGRIQSTFSAYHGESKNSLKTEAHQNGTDTVPEPRKGAASCGVHGIVFVIFGGVDSQANSLTDTWIYLIEKARWLPLSEDGSQLVYPPTPWSTTISWCHLDALYVIGNSTDYIPQMWKFSLRTLKWSDESLSLELLQHCPNGSLQSTQRSTANDISVVWNATFYLYQWLIVHSDNDSLIISIDLKRWPSFPSTKFTDDWYSRPMLWAELNSFYMQNAICNSPAILQCGDINGQSCKFHKTYQITSGTLWPKQRIHSSSWFYNGNIYIFGGRAVFHDSEIFFNDLYMLHPSYSIDSHNVVLLLSFAIAVVAVILSGLSIFCILRCCDYHQGRKKSRELRIRYMPLRDMSLHEWYALNYTVKHFNDWYVI